MMITIDLAHGSKENRYITRLVWQELFNLYRNGGGDLFKMDNLLCDLYVLEQSLKRTNSIDLYWTFDICGFTKILSFPMEGYHRILWDGKSDTITIEQVKVEYQKSITV